MRPSPWASRRAFPKAEVLPRAPAGSTIQSGGSQPRCCSISHTIVFWPSMRQGLIELSRDDAQGLRGLAREPQARVEVALHEERPRAVGEGLGQLPRRHLPRRDEDERRQAGLRRVGGHRGRGVPGGRAGHRGRARAHGLGHGHGHAAVLERAGGVLALVLEDEVLVARVARDRLAPVEGGVPLGVREDGASAGQQELAEAPDAAALHRSVSVAAAPVEAAAERRPRSRAGTARRRAAPRTGSRRGGSWRETSSPQAAHRRYGLFTRASGSLGIHAGEVQPRRGALLRVRRDHGAAHAWPRSPRARSPGGSAPRRSPPPRTRPPRGPPRGPARSRGRAGCGTARPRDPPSPRARAPRRRARGPARGRPGPRPAPPRRRGGRSRAAPRAPRAVSTP